MGVKEKSSFEVGATVRLKSGSPLMTVRGVGLGDGDVVECVWFQKGTSAPEIRLFPAATLEASSKKK